MITKEDVIIKYFHCTCRKEYKDKKIIDPGCFVHKHVNDLRKLMDDWETECLRRVGITGNKHRIKQKERDI